MGATGRKGKTTKARSMQPRLKDYVSWFEIPAHNFQRAVTFYSHIYDIKMETAEMSGYAMAFFPAVNGVGGAVVVGDGCIPSDTGTLVYLNAGTRLDEILARIEPAGGRVVMGRTLISDDAGYFALFIDTEGNKLALHSKK
ncbi:MAG: VOC family protein [Candidatus Krumholzibacteria bacterium]|nr:VOC family protein [Candidatus Krumholzibacteria bacterium]MDH4337373.1 VOC family protein [Candidatus Krumholzibacteria bacterium]MDH5270134.1 VOC family protein [Candidatus Krumholzibacteria bacterium]MDH5627658.1 VOC family protein [Candidatus Krumholzibacteria bacterium]